MLTYVPPGPGIVHSGNGKFAYFEDDAADVETVEINFAALPEKVQAIYFIGIIDEADQVRIGVGNRCSGTE